MKRYTLGYTVGCVLSNIALATGPLLQPKGQSSIFYKVPSPLTQEHPTSERNPVTPDSESEGGQHDQVPLK
jgi:hypothetical protein